jgi:type IV pilus assembly protein PilO
MRAYDVIGQVWRYHHKALKALAVLLVLNVCLFVAINQWLVPQVLDKERTFLQKQAEQRSRLHSQGGGKSTQQRYVLASQDLSKFKQSIPAYEEFTGLIEELLVLSNQARLNITQIGYVSEDVEKSSLLKFKLSFNVAGNYDQVKKFIHSLEQSVRLLAITRVSLKGTDEKEVRLQLNLETYFNQKEKGS